MAEKPERWFPNGVKGCKERRDLPKGNGLRGGRVHGTMIRTVHVNSRSLIVHLRSKIIIVPVARLLEPVAHEGVVVQDQDRL